MASNVRDERSELQAARLLQADAGAEDGSATRRRAGFYKKVKGAAGKEERLALGLEDARISSRAEAQIPCARDGEERRETWARACACCWPGRRPAEDDKAARFSGRRSTRPVDVCGEPHSGNFRHGGRDRSRHALGFNWEMGPFELWDAAGVEATVARMKKEGKPVAANVEKLLGCGRRRAGTRTILNRRPGARSLIWRTGNYKPVTGSRGRLVGRRWRRNPMAW